MGTLEARIYEQGNGLPVAGDYCWGAGVLYRVEWVGAWVQNSVYATVREADLSECAEGDEHTAYVVVAR